MSNIRVVAIRHIINGVLVFGVYGHLDSYVPTKEVLSSWIDPLSLYS